jgi:hypothetical protein
VNAGCPPDLGRARLYRHDGSRLLAMGWLDAAEERAETWCPVPAAA